MAARGRFGNIVLCEHVVQSSGNKHTLVNAYSGDILVATLPARLMLGLYVEYCPAAGEREIQLEIRLDRKTFARLRAVLTVLTGGAPETAGAIGVIVLPVFEVGVDRPLTLSVVAHAHAGPARTVLRKKIALGIPDAGDPNHLRLPPAP